MKIDFEKYKDGLVPAVVQDSFTRKVLMVGFMNRNALKRTEKLGKATFFSRKRKQLWTKGETSGNYLIVNQLLIDCDEDTILIKATPIGKVCHKGSDTCFGEINDPHNFLDMLESVIANRKANPVKESHTTKLFELGLNQIAKKVGEEAVELVIEAVNKNDNLFKEEASDLLYYFMVLLVERGVKLEDINGVLKQRHDQRKS